MSRMRHVLAGAWVAIALGGITTAQTLDKELVASISGVRVPERLRQ
jgi:hypothetical protein